MERMTSGILEVPGTTRNRSQPSYLCRVTFDGLIRQISPLPSLYAISECEQCIHSYKLWSY